MLSILLLTIAAGEGWMPYADHVFRTIPNGSLKFGSDVWQVQYRRYLVSKEMRGQLRDPDEAVRVLKNGRQVFHFTQEGYLVIIRAHTPASFPVFILKAHSENGHGESTWVYGIRSGKFFQMAKLPSGEIGGPVYRDLDNDGSMEWIVDDYDWYTYYNSSPKWLYAYKLQTSGRLKLWRKLKSNPSQPLPRDQRFFH